MYQRRTGADGFAWYIYVSCFHCPYLTLLFLTGTPENRSRRLSCEETCEEDAYDHVKACSSLRMLSKFLHYVISNSGNKGCFYQKDGQLEKAVQHANHFNK